MNRRSLPAVVALIALAIGTRFYFLLSTGYLVDDAMITFRYAENLATGMGFVYNPGEHVLGTTTPLWTCYLALLNYCRIPVTIAAQTTGIILAGLTSLVVYGFARSLGAGALAIAAGVGYALYPRSVVVDICGLETALFSCLLLTTVYWLSTGQYSWAMIFAALATLTRPEGALILVVAGIITWRKSPRTPVIGLIVAATLVMVWVVFATTHFGSPIPNSLSAKAALYSSSSTTSVHRVAEMLLLTQPLGWLLLFVGVTGALITKVRRFWLFVTTGIVLAFALPVAVFSSKTFFWYPAPLIPLSLVVIAAGSAVLLNWIFPNHGRQSIAIVTAVACVLAVSAAGLILPARIESLNQEMNWYRTTHIAAAEYLNLHAASGEVVLAEDIGHFGYHYRGRVVDRDGLVSPVAIPYNRLGQYSQFVDSVAPDWILLAAEFPSSAALLKDEKFNGHFQQIDYAPGLSPRTHVLYRSRALNPPN